MRSQPHRDGMPPSLRAASPAKVVSHRPGTKTAKHGIPNIADTLREREDITKLIS